MGITDFFRPKYRHSDVKVRLEAVRAMSSDESDILATVARTDRDPGVRKVAIEKLDLADVLAEIAREEADRALKALAGSRAAELWISAANGEDAALAGAALAGLIKLGDQRAVVAVATRAALADIKRRAIESIEDPRALAELAKTASDPAVRAQVLGQIDDPEVLRAVAVDTKFKELGIAAVERLSSTELLEQVAKSKAAHKAVKQRAQKKLDELAETARAQRPQVSDEARRRKAEHAQLLREVEGQVETFEWERSFELVSRAEAAWARLGAAADDSVEERFRKATRRYHARRQAAIEANARALMDAEDRRREAERRAREQAEAAAARDADKAARDADRAARDDAPSARDDAREPEDDARRAEREARRAADAERRAAEEAERAARKAEAEARGAQIAASLDALITDLESLIGTKDGRAVDRALEQAAKAFSQLGKVAADQRDALDRRYQDVRGRLVVAIRELREAEDWQRWTNVPRAEALIKEAAALLEAEAPPTLDALKALQARWKQLGAVPANKNKELWERFKTTTDQVFDRIKGVRAVEAEKFAAVAQLKEQLIAQAEVLAASTDWETTAPALKDLQRQWKESGHLPRKQGDELWKRFRAACDRFFEARKPHLDAQVADQQANLDAKTRLCERAEAIVAAAPGEGGWGAAITAIRNAQREWKDIGFVPRKDADAIWARFRAACDALFTKRDEARDAEAGAQRAEVDAVRAELDGLDGLAPAEAVARVVAARGKLRELAARGIAPGAELAGEIDRAVRGVMASAGEALAGTELDPAAMAARRDKLIARAEELVPKQPALEPGLSPEQLVAKLKSAIASRALGDFGASRDPFEAVHELRAAWAEIGPVVGADAEAAAARFEDACGRVLAAAEAEGRRPARDEARGGDDDDRGPRRRDRGERRDRPERGERGDRGDRGRRERRADGDTAAVTTASPTAETVRSAAPAVAAVAAAESVAAEAVAETIRNTVPPPPSPGQTPAAEAPVAAPVEAVAVAPAVVAAPAPVVVAEAPAPVVEAPAPVVVAEAPAPVVEAPAPVVEAPAPAPAAAEDIDSGWD